MESNHLHSKYNKSISTIFHSQEWEHYCCFVTIIFDKKKMSAQLYKSALTFLTLSKTTFALHTFPNATLTPAGGQRYTIHTIKYTSLILELTLPKP